MRRQCLRHGQRARALEHFTGVSLIAEVRVVTEVLIYLFNDDNNGDDSSCLNRTTAKRYSE
jgi:hypothetical protein